MSTNTISKNPTGFTFSIKHKSKQSGTTSAPKIDLSKPVIKHKATNNVKTINSKKGGRKTYKKTRGKKHRGKTHKKIRRKTHKKK